MSFFWKHKHFTSSTHHNNGSTLALVIFICLLFTGYSQSQLISFVPNGRQYVTNGQGIISLDSTLTHSLLIYGFNLTNTTLLKWTESTTQCDESSSLYGTTQDLATTLIQNDVFQGIFTVSFPLITSSRTLYFCVRYDDSETYSHQGSELVIIVQPPTNPLFPLPVTILFILVLMVLSGLFSGLNLGLMSLDPVTLKIIEKSGSKRQKKYAKIIYRVRRFGNYLLCTLLLGNVLVNSTFTILLDSVIGSGIYAVIGSTLAIVIFGEIVPQAICSRYGLMIGAYTIWLTYIFMVLTFPLALPISLLLNLILGKEIGAVYNRQQLLELLNVTREGAEIDDTELGILSGALKFKDKTVGQIMTKYEHVFCVDIDSILDFRTIKQIYDSGFSRIPIYEEDKNNIVGILHVRDLTFIDPEDCIPIRQLKEFYNRTPTFVFDDTTLQKQLSEFVETGCHIAIVHCVVEEDDADNSYEVVGVITLEDIIEEIIGREIVDEYDQFEDNVTHKKRKRLDRHVDIAQVMYTTPVISLSAQQKLAVAQYLSSAVEPFHEKFVTKNVLNYLLQQDIVFKLTPENNLLYQPRIPANYFTLLLEGCLRVIIGGEQLQFEARGFYSFGISSLMDTSKDYLPDFKVNIETDCLVLIITRRRYQAALRASQFEKEHTDNNNTTLTRSNAVFYKEWETAENVDLQAGLAGTDGLTNITHLLRTKPLQGLSTQLSSNGCTSSTSLSPVEERIAQLQPLTSTNTKESTV